MTLLYAREDTGNVGLRTTAPNQTLDVNGTAVVGTSNYDSTLDGEGYFQVFVRVEPIYSEAPIFVDGFLKDKGFERDNINALEMI